MPSTNIPEVDEFMDRVDETVPSLLRWWGTEEHTEKRANDNVLSLSVRNETCKRGHQRTPENTYHPPTRKYGECLLCKRQRERSRYQKLTHLPRRELVEKALADDRGRPLHGRTKICMFNHSMRRIESRSWFCDHPKCRLLVVSPGNRPGLYQYHQGTNYLVFCEEEAQDYLQGKKTLLELVNTLTN